MRYHWEDGLEWLGVSSTGLLRCGPQEGFENGGANIVAIHPTLGEHHNFFRISLPFTEKNNGEEISVGEFMDEYGRRGVPLHML